MASLFIALTITLPWLGASGIWCVGDTRPRAQHALAVGFSVAAGLCALMLLPFASPEIIVRLPSGGVFGDFTFAADGLGVFLAVLAAVIGSLTVIFSIDYLHGEPQLGRYYALVLLFIGAMCGLVLTQNLLLLFFFWEVVAFCSYALISFHNDDPNAVAGGIKALVITQIGGVGLLVGVLMVYANLGSYDFRTFILQAHTLPSTTLSIIAFGFLIAAAAKSAQVPFHTWLPAAMEAPTPVSALIHAATMVNAGVYLLARFYPAFAHVPAWKETVMTMGVASALLAALMALFADDLKRVLAYSTISQLGYMMYAIGVGASFASQFHLLSHAVFKALLFLSAGAVIHALGTRNLQAIGGRGAGMPFTRNAFVVGALALMGVPFFNGFWSKELLLEAGLREGALWAYVAMLVGVALTALYTARVTWWVFFALRHKDLTGMKRGNLSGLKRIHDAPLAMRLALAPLALGSLTTWLLAASLSQLLGTHMLSLSELISEIITAPTTYLVLIVMTLGAVAWWRRARLTPITLRLPWLRQSAVAGFGFEWVNARMVSATRRAANTLRVTQTGQLNWNIVGIVGGLIVVLVMLRWGAR
jgi:NADH-quinone oxidoreductase subunit L